MRQLFLTLAVLALALFADPLSISATEPAKTILVIVGQKLSITKISRDDLRLIFQTKKKTWPDGTAAIPFNLPPGDPTRHAFDSAVLGLEPNLVARYWIDRRIRGGDRPPNAAPSSLMMVRVVSALSGAIGYVEPEAINEQVKVIAKIVGGEVVAP